jgi:hypothetical protein
MPGIDRQRVRGLDLMAEERRSIEGEAKLWRRSSDAGCWLDNYFCPVCGSTAYWYAEFAPDEIDTLRTHWVGNPGPFLVSDELFGNVRADLPDTIFHLGGPLGTPGLPGPNPGTGKFHID